MEYPSIELLMMWTEWTVYNNPTFTAEFKKKAIDAFGSYNADRFETVFKAITEKYNAEYYPCLFIANNDVIKFHRKDNSYIHFVTRYSK